MDSEYKNSKSRPTASPRALSPVVQINLRAQAEHILQNAVLMTEMGMDLKEKAISGQKYVSYLRTITVRAGKIMNTLQSSSKAFLMLAQRAAQSMVANTEAQSSFAIRLEYERLLGIVEKELADLDEIEGTDSSSPTYGVVDMTFIADKIKYLEAKQKLLDNSLLPPSGSTKSVKSDVDEKYPENLSRESLIDLNNVASLPTVPEDIFTCFSTKPTRTSSWSSLKSMRKVKLFLQRASSGSDGEESSESEDPDYSKFGGDCDDIRPNTVTAASAKKVCLANIKEETQQD